MSTPSDVDLICQTAREQIRKRQFAAAVATYESLLATHERDPQVQEGLATAAFLLGDLPRAVQHFKRLTQVDVRRAEPLVNLGAVYNRQGDYDSAVKTLRQALNKNRRCAEAYYNLGIAHKGLHQLSLAVSAYRESIRLSPQMAEAHQNLGNVFVEMGNLQQAILCFRRALDINPQFDRARRAMEAAQQKAHEKSRNDQPFGRLVDVQKLKQQAAASSTSRRVQRALTETEREVDRQILHRLAGQFESRATLLQQQVRDHLGPALLGLFNAVSQTDDPRRLIHAQETLGHTLEQYRQATVPLFRGADDLQAHEDEMGRIMGQPS